MTKHQQKFSKSEYKKSLYQLQVSLVKLQRHIIRHGHQILVIFEGRDASGKDGVIKRIVRHLSPRETRVVALGKPTEREYHSWYFQRYVNHLPAREEMVLFNRSWYNRAGVERVMQFCNESEYDLFMQIVNEFEAMLIQSGINLLKYYLDISKQEQARRLEDRKNDPLKQWKISPIDDKAIELWDDYSQARNQMLERTHTGKSPWIIVRADNKKLARLNIIRDMLSRIECPDRDEHLCIPDPEIVFTFKKKHQNDGMIVK